MNKFKKFVNVFLDYKIIGTNYKSILFFIWIFSLSSLVIGIVMIFNFQNLFEYKNNITQNCIESSKCTLNFQVFEPVKGPLYFYIFHEDFYVNNRKVMLSQDWKQLKGEILEKENLETNCSNYDLVEDGKRFYDQKFESKEEDQILHPCGLYALLFPQSNLISPARLF